MEQNILSNVEDEHTVSVSAAFPNPIFFNDLQLSFLFYCKYKSIIINKAVIKPN